MTNRWRLLATGEQPGAVNMAVDEAILEAVAEGASPPTLRFFAWNPPCLSLGYAQPFADVDPARLAERGWEVVRRPTGGRAILHTDELTYSITAPLDEPRVAGGVLESYNRLATALLKAVQLLDMPVEMTEGPTHGGNGASGPVCFEVPSAYEITVDGKKLIGSAQARRKGGVLQHGTLPLTGDLARITESLVFADDTARARAAVSLLQRATTVEMALGHEVSAESANQAFVTAFQSELGLSFQHGELSASEISRAEQLVREKYAYPSWTERV